MYTTPIGKVVLPKSEFDGGDEWYNLYDASFEDKGTLSTFIVESHHFLVSGSALFKLKYDGQNQGKHNFIVELIEAKDLGLKSGTFYYISK